MSQMIRNTMDAIRRGKDLEIHLPQFGRQMAEQYYRAALFDFAMQYVVTYESVTDSEPESEMNICLTALREEVKKNLLDSFDGQVMERSVEKLHEMREEIIRRMEVLTAYADMLENYEYVLNRIEAKYLPDPVVYGDAELDQVTEEIFSYVFDTSDNVVINEKIKEVLGQLPARMTKQKFCDLVRDSLSIYMGADRSSLELYEYMIRTGAMLYHPEGMGKYYQDLQDAVDMLAELDYDDLTEEQFRSAGQTLQNAAAFIEETVNTYMTLAADINNLYVLVLTAPYGEWAFPGREQAEQIIRITEQAFEGEFATESDYMDAVTDALTGLEGKLEEPLELVAMMEGALEDSRMYQDLQESLMLRPLYESLRVCALLRSDSVFADMNEKPQEIPVTQEILDEVGAKLLDDFLDGFKKQKRAVRRAVMAGTLSRMPVFFGGRQDVLDYVRGALYGCTNQAELAGSIGMLRDIMGNIYD